MWIEIYKLYKQKRRCRVTPFAGVWIEIKVDRIDDKIDLVTPFAGVWIEIQNAIGNGNIAGNVTPFAGVRIEISPPGRRLLILVVTPFVGVWIEMVFRGEISPSKIMSLSLRECRLKSKSLSLGEILD